MRLLIGTVAATLMSVALAFAGQVEGKIKKIDQDNLTITLDDGKSYKLPGEFDVESIQEGMDVVLAYDEVGGVKLITDIVLN